MSATRVVVHGDVQGVFFRARCTDAATAAGVTGWVANQPDGTVGAWFEGPDDAVEELVRWCHEGSPGARVQRVEVEAVEPEGHESFEQR